MGNRSVKLVLNVSLALTLLWSAIPARASSPAVEANKVSAVSVLAGSANMSTDKSPLVQAAANSPGISPDILSPFSAPAGSPGAPPYGRSQLSGMGIHSVVADGAPPMTSDSVGNANAPAGQVKEVHQVTLITGDVVTVVISENGTRSFAIAPADSSKLGQHFMTVEQNGDTYIFPDGVDLTKLDKELFNIDYLVTEQYYQQSSLPLIVSYSPNLPLDKVQSLEGEVTALGQETQLQAEVGTLSTRVDYQSIASAYDTLISQPDVSKIWLDRKVHAELNVSVPLISAPALWAAGYNGTGVKIAILDTGIDSSRPGLNSLNGNPANPKVIVNMNFSDDTGFNDLFGHGTHVAGIAAGTGAGSNYTGVAPGAWLWNVKVLNQFGYGYDSWIINGINFASLGLDGVAGTGDEANIISMSLGGGVTDGTDPMSQAVNLAVDRGVTVVIAAGNSGSGMSTVSTPGAASKVITVGASDKNDILAYFSSRGPTPDGRIKPDILAPGVDITSTMTTNPAAQIKSPTGYGSLSGTSMATPHVAGAAALLRQEYGANATPQFIKDSLMSTSKDIGYNVYQQGAGRLDLAAGLGQKVGVTPASLSLGQFTSATAATSANLTFTNSDDISHRVSISVNLTDAYTGDTYGTGISHMQWQKTVGGWDNDGVWSVQQTADGGYIAAGNTMTFGAGGGDVYLIKTDASGNVIWNRTFGGTSTEFGWNVQQTSDGGYIIAGYTYSFGAGGSDVYLVKTNSSGNLIWQKTFGGINYDEAWSVEQTADGGYIIAGDTNSFGAGDSDVYLIKTDGSGNLTWQKTFGGTNFDYGYSVKQTDDGGYIIGGCTGSLGAGNADVYLVKTDASGNLAWQKTFGGTNSDYGRSVQQTTGGGYIIGGYTYSLGAGNADVYLVKTDASGNLIWQKTYGGASDDIAVSVQQTGDGGYFTGGTTYSSGAGNGDVYVVKTDSSGRQLWQKTIGGTNYDQGNAVRTTADGGCIIAGYTYSFGAGNADAYLIKLTSGDVANPASLNTPSFTIPAHGQVQVNLNINLSALPSSLYGGMVVASIDNTTAIHAIFGFSKLNKVTVHKTDITGAPAQNTPVWIMARDQFLGANQFYGTTNKSGSVSIYLPDGNYDLISPNWGPTPPGVNPSDIWTIAENTAVASDKSINLDERDTKVVDFNPNKPGLIPAGKVSILSYRSNQYGYGWGSSWYYPQSFATRVSSISKFSAGFHYSAYPQVDFARDGAGLVNTNEWLNLMYSSNNIAGNVTFTANYTNLVHRNTVYGVALTGERAYVQQYSVDSISNYSAGFGYQMDVPQQRWEWLSPSPVQYYQYYSNVTKSGNNWEFGSNWFSYPSGTAAGNYGFHPFTSGVYEGGGSNYLYVEGPISRDSAGNNYYGNIPGHLKVTQNRTNVLFDNDVSDSFWQYLNFTGAANFTVEVWGQTSLALSRSSYARLDFFNDPNHDSRPPQLNSIVVPSINASGVVPGGRVKVQVEAYDESQIASVHLHYSLDDNATWIDAGLPTGSYVFNLGQLQNTFVSIAVDATDQYGNHIYRSTNRAFYVGSPPSITVNQSSMDVTLTPGSNTTRTITIGNTGNGNLTFSVSDNLSNYLGSSMAGYAAVSSSELNNATSGISSGQAEENSTVKQAEITQVTPSSSPEGPAQVALFEDSLPWGYSTTQEILTAHGISYDVYNSSQMGNVDLSQYKKVITASVQYSTFWNALEANKAWFESYVRAGGVLEMHLASQDDSDGKVFPGGFVVHFDTYNSVSIAEPGHPVLNIPNVITAANLNGWNWSTHGWFSSIPPGGNVVITSDLNGQPVFVESSFGLGSIFATVQTVEWKVGYPKFLENMIAYVPGPAAVRWLTEDPKTGTVKPGTTANISVTFNSSNLTPGRYSANISIDHNDGLAAIPWTVPVTLTVASASPLVATNNATGITGNSATLNGSLASLGAYSSANVSFEWGTVSGNLTRQTSTQLMTSTGNFSTILRDLSSNTTYYFRTKAVGDGIAYGSEQNFNSLALISMLISPPNPGLLPGKTQQFTAIGIYADNSTSDITSSVNWTSSNNSTATINSSGLAAALVGGNTTITASSGNISAGTVLTVVTSVEVNAGQTIMLVSNEIRSNIPLAINGMPGNGNATGVGSFIFNLSWNKDVIHVDNITGGPVTGFNILAGIPNNATGTANITGAFSGSYLTGNNIVANLGISAVGSVGNSTSINVVITSLNDQNVNPVTATAVNATANIVTLVAETGLGQGLDAGGVAGVNVNLKRVKDPSCNATGQVPGGIGSYAATANMSPASGIQLVSISGIAPFDGTSFNATSGVFSVANVSSPFQAGNTTVARVVLILTGNATTVGSLTVCFNTISAASMPGLNVPEERSNTITFLRGDADKNGEVNVVDSLAIKQYLVGQLSLSQINPVNASGSNHDGAGGDKITVVDALAIEQMLVHQLDAYFQ